LRKLIDDWDVKIEKNWGFFFWEIHSRELMMIVCSYPRINFLFVVWLRYACCCCLSTRMDSLKKNSSIFSSVAIITIEFTFLLFLLSLFPNQGLKKEFTLMSMERILSMYLHMSSYLLYWNRIINIYFAFPSSTFYKLVKYNISLLY
jgi:hypothetical protein